MNYLALLPRIVFPADTGAKIRNLNMFSRLSQAGDTCTIVCYRSPEDKDEDVERMRSICTRLELVQWEEAVTFSARSYVAALANLFSPYPYAVQKYLTPQFQSRVESLIRNGSFDAIVIDTAQLSLLAGAERRALPIICFEHNVEYVVRQRQYEAARNPLLKAFFYYDYRRMKRFERRLGQRADHLIMVSDKDRETMSAIGVNNTSAVPLGVDTEFFSPAGPGGPALRTDALCFTGSMDWLPNDDGIRWFLREVLPLIQANGPVSLSVVGRAPAPDLARMAAGIPGIEVTGRVPDVRPYVANAAVYIVPLRIGGGTRIKIFEAMAMGKAVVSTTTGAEGLPVTHGDNIVLADEAETFAREVVSLLNDPAKAQAIGNRARTLVQERYSWTAAASVFADTCRQAVERRRAS
ncbi:MAG: glycosyltransferase [Vicinamibacterales bacterium]